ncbi:MAG: DUF1294 domain-containing protein [Intestinibacter bartlettii]|uniref:DUF1294 domain-containing protein n=1 Tax=Intestinibacter bartlettii TaxID=261299 RepID=UPI0026EBEDF0|nr:DUF1294 domain-containing protein [Intestinibacter bartlettii]MDO5009711.1 DUF1294 domain-containing protein [Intestinibacter bartlettii]
MFCLMCIDKKRAIKNQFRISEKKLLTIAFLGGSIGMLAAMNIIHHKGKKFKSFIPFFILESFFLLFILSKSIML